jgi:murein DD-endopeptidase MepM/ murein hydrolase activator NlpD
VYRYPFNEPHHVSSPYGPRGSGFHGGVDFGWEPETGPSFPVLATQEGTVCYLADESAYGGGNVINIDHPDGGQSRYFHLHHWEVELGQAVGMGEQIAMSGDTGVPGQPHLHFELLDANGARYDPLTVLVWTDDEPEPGEDPEMPSYACSLLRNEYAQVFVHDGLTRRWLPNQDAINVLLGTGLCNPNIQDVPAVYLDTIPWDPADPYYPTSGEVHVQATEVDEHADRRGDG